MNRKTLLYNGQIMTVDKNDSIQESVLFQGDRILYVGKTAGAMRLIDNETELRDLHGCAVVPGFIDCHIHMAVAEAKSGKEMYLTRDGGIKTVADVLDAIKKAAAERSEGEWIIGSAYSHEDLEEMRHITIGELDEVAPNNPVMLVHKSGHMSVCNSAAFDLAEESGLLFPSEHTVMTEKGELTGLLKETAHFMMLAHSPLLPEESVLVNGIEKFCKKLIAEGITSCHDAGGYGKATYQSLCTAKNEGKLKNRVYTMLWTLFGKEAQIKNAKTMMDSGFVTGFGDLWLKKGPVKIMVDGSAVGGSCSTTLPILPEGKVFPTTFSQEELDEIFVEAHKNGFQLTAHGAGDKAVEMIINSIEKAMKLYPRKDPRHRIEHCFICTPEQIKRIKDLGIIPVPNPGFLSVWGSVFEKYYGDRQESLIPLRSFEEAGVMTPFGSDAMVIDKYEPLLGIAAAMERRDLNSGTVIAEGQRIGLLRALRCYTYFGAYASFEEKEKGSIEVGKLADMVVLSDSLLGKSPEEIRKIRVKATYLGGQLAYKE